MIFFNVGRLYVNLSIIKSSKSFKYTIITVKSKIYLSWKSWKHNFVCKLSLYFSHTLRQFLLRKTHFLTVPGAGQCPLQSNRTSFGMAKLEPGLGTWLWAFIKATWTTLGWKTSDHLLALCTIGVIANNIQIQDSIYDQALVPLFPIKIGPWIWQGMIY